MGRSPAEQFEVFAPTAQQRAAAILAVFGGSHQRADRYLQRAADDREELILAIRDSRGNISHASMLIRSPGRTALIFATPPRAFDDQQRGACLIGRSVAHAGKIDAVIVQALIEPFRSDDLAMFALGGMTPIGTLAYLERPSSKKSTTQERALPTGVSIRPWKTSDRALLEDLLTATYIDSLDCPGLAEMRRTSDILDGHIGAGILDPSTWLILDVNGTPSGVSLMSEIPGSRCVEIVYFGLTPSARGQGLGGHLLDYALKIVQERADFPIALACDELNSPAMRLYQARGFNTRLRRAALIGRVPDLALHIPTTCPPTVDKCDEKTP